MDNEAWDLLRRIKKKLKKKDYVILERKHYLLPDLLI